MVVIHYILFYTCGSHNCHTERAEGEHAEQDSSCTRRLATTGAVMLTCMYGVSSADDSIAIESPHMQLEISKSTPRAIEQFARLSSLQDSLPVLIKSRIAAQPQYAHNPWIATQYQSIIVC